MVNSADPQMGDALWLFFALPSWYFAAAAHPVRAGIFSLVPFVGTLGLVAGAVASIVGRKQESMLFFLPVVMSQCFVAIAGFMRGQLRGNLSLVPMFIFVAAQLFLAGYFGYNMREVPIAALSLAVFSASYALFALFVGAMAFADSWL